MNFHVKRTRQVVVSVHRTLINDGRLSPYDVGLFLILASQHSNHEFSLTSISKNHNCGVQSIKTSIRNLSRCGYLKWIEKEKTFILNDNPNMDDSVKQFSKPIKKKEVVPKMTKEDAVKINAANTKLFIEATKEAVYSLMKKPQYASGIDPDIIDRFIKWWTEADTLKPEDGLRYQECKKFDHKRRLATFIKRAKERNQKDKL